MASKKSCPQKVAVRGLSVLSPYSPGAGTGNKDRGAAILNLQSQVDEVLSLPYCLVQYCIYSAYSFPLLILMNWS